MILTIWFLHSIFSPAQPRELSYSDFVNEVKAGHLEEVRITETKLIGTYKKDVLKTLKPPTKNPQITAIGFPGWTRGPLVQDLEAQHVKFSGTIPSGDIWTGVLISWGPLLLLFVIYFVAMRKMQKGGGDRSASAAIARRSTMHRRLWIPSSATWRAWRRPRASCGRLSIS